MIMPEQPPAQEDDIEKGEGRCNSHGKLKQAVKSSCRTMIQTMLMSIPIPHWQRQNWKYSVQNSASYRSCWPRHSIIVCSWCCTEWMRAARLIRFSRPSHEAIPRDARCMHLKRLHSGTSPLISSGVSIGSPLEGVS